MLRFLFFFILLLFFNKNQAQDIRFDENCVLFQDAKTSLPVLILEDSILYKGNPLTKTKYNHTPYPDELLRYISYSIKGKTFLVQGGSGPVLEYRNDSIVACNKTPIFQNQIGSAKFVYKNELHFFGGYGLFTYKNIVTKYDATNKDWIQVQTFGDEIPSPRSAFYSCLVNENLYVFGGIEDDPANFPNFKKCDNTIWRLHLPTMHWDKMGKFNSSLLGTNTFSTFPANDKLYLISISAYGTAYEVDIVKNTIKKFAPKTLIKPTQIYFDNTKKELVCVTWISNGKYKLFQANLKTFLGKPIEESEFIMPFYEELTTTSFGFGIGILFIVLGITIFLKKHKTNRLLPFNGIVFKKETGNCYYKNKLIDNLEEPELRILLYLIENAMRFVPLNELNHLFDNANNADNFSSIVKRRELTLAGLLQKLSNLTNIPEKELLMNRKNPDDKRIKEIRISPSFLKIK
ncbi:MAG: hypothetical protein RL619_216 [Bacteroidota bacterium]|jgi:hypothetical protein